MIAALTLILIFAVSFFLIRVASVALRLTGLSGSNARFQAMSALTGTGFTTTEAELITNYPIRRNIIAGLMLLGNLGIVSIISTTMISFVRIDADFQAVMTQLAWMVGGTILFFTVMLNPFVDRTLCGLIRYILKKHTFLGGRHYNRLLQLGDKLSVSEHQFFDHEPVAAAQLQTRFGDMTILAVKRSSGETQAFSQALSPICPGDSLIIFGLDGVQEKFGAEN